MDFSARILDKIHHAGLSFPGLDDQAILDRVLPTAEEWVVTQIVSHHLSEDDQVLFRDSYASAPDIFDPVEFLSDLIPDFDTLVDQYFEQWIDNFKKQF